MWRLGVAGAASAELRAEKGAAALAELRAEKGAAALAELRAEKGATTLCVEPGGRRTKVCAK